MNNSESGSYDKNDMQKKVNVLVRLHEVIQEKLKTASYSEPIHILVPWYLINGLECTVKNILISLNEIKKVGEILVQPAPEKGKKLSSMKHFI